MNYVDAAIAPLRKTGQIKIHGPAAFEGMRKAGRLAAECLDMLAGEIHPGVPTERLDRLAAVAILAEDVFEDENAAARWMATPNDALGGNTPVLQCETEIGARQVRRILHAIEWGGVA